MDENPSGASAPSRPSEDFVSTLQMALLTSGGLQEVVKMLNNRSKKVTAGDGSEGQRESGHQGLSLTQQEFVALCEELLANPLVCEESADARYPETRVALKKIRLLAARLIAAEACAASLAMKDDGCTKLEDASVEAQFPLLLALCRATRAGIHSSKNSSRGVAIACGFVSVLLVLPPAVLTEAFKVPSFVSVVKAVIHLGSMNACRRFSLALSKHRRQHQCLSFHPTSIHQQIRAEQVLKRAVKRDTLLRQLLILVRDSHDALQLALQVAGCNSGDEGEAGIACLWILSTWCKGCLLRQRRSKSTALYGTAEATTLDETRQRTVTSALAIKETLLQRLVRVGIFWRI